MAAIDFDSRPFRDMSCCCGCCCCSREEKRREEFNDRVWGNYKAPASITARVIKPPWQKNSAGTEKTIKGCPPSPDTRNYPEGKPPPNRKNWITWQHRRHTKAVKRRLTDGQPPGRTDAIPNLHTESKKTQMPPTGSKCL